MAGTLERRGSIEKSLDAARKRANARVRAPRLVETCYFPIHMDRRKFIRNAIAASAASAAAPAAGASKMVGIQVGAVSFVDEGVEKVLDEFQQDASINTLFVATFTYGRGIAGRQVPGQPLPDHGKQAYDTDTFKGGSYTRIASGVLSRHGAAEIFARPISVNSTCWRAVLPAARKRGMKTICWFEDVWGREVPNIAQAQEKQSRRAERRRPCASTIPTTGTGCWAR